MTWKDARKNIEDRNNIDVGTDVNTVKENGDQRSKYRIVKCVCDWGFRIPKGKNSDMRVTWDMLEKCWKAMKKNQGVYNDEVFKNLYSGYPGCYVHTIGKIFEKAGLVDSVKDKFYVLK